MLIHAWYISHDGRFRRSYLLSSFKIKYKIYLIFQDILAIDKMHLYVIQGKEVLDIEISFNDDNDFAYEFRMPGMKIARCSLVVLLHRQQPQLPPMSSIIIDIAWSRISRSSLHDFQFKILLLTITIRTI